MNRRRSLLRAAFGALTGAFVGVNAGCSSLPRTAQALFETAPVFALQGRFSATVTTATGSENLTARIEWKHAANADELTLGSPLGNDLARITRNAQGVELITARQERFTAPDVESLTQTHLGFTLPLTQLVAWVQAEPATTSAQVERDAQGRALRLNEDGWVIEYVYADEASKQARRITMLRAASATHAQSLELRLVIERWA